MFYTGLDLVIHRCVREDEIFDILKAFHDESCGGHFADKRTSYKIMHMGYYLPSIFKDAKNYVKGCVNCQRMGNPGVANDMPLQS